MNSQNTGVIDADLLFSDGVDFNASAASRTLDIGFANPDIGAGSKQVVRVFCHSVATGTDTGTLEFKLQGSKDKASWPDLLKMDVKGSDLRKGDSVLIPITQECPRYLRIFVTKPATVAGRKLTIDLTVGP